MSKQRPASRRYELVTIIDMDHPAPAEAANLVKEIIIEAKAGVVRTDDWGKRELAYPIQKKTHGSYFCFIVEGPGEAITQIERNLKISDFVIRFMTVHKDEFAPDFIPPIEDGAENSAEEEELAAV